VVPRPPHKLACAYLPALFAAEKHYLHRPRLRDTVSFPLTRFLDRSAAKCTFSDWSTHTQEASDADAMRPNLDSATASTTRYLPPDAKLQAGYIRYIRILPTEGPEGEICFETCIRRSRSRFYPDSDENGRPVYFHYSAISYSWGDPTPSHSIIVDGHQRPVAENLWRFLERANFHAIGLQQERAQRVERVRSVQARWRSEQFRSPIAYSEFEDAIRDFPRGASARYIERVWIDESFLPLSPSFNRVKALKYIEFEHGLQDLMAERRGWPEDWLWIDALCIDQSDARERTHQVGIMSEIFGEASRVISWLGPAYDNSEHAMATISGTYDSSTSMQPILSQIELSEAISSLCERQYWKRLWVFQELRHAQSITLMCGAHTITWKEFALLWRTIVDLATTDEERFERLKQSLATRMMTLRSKPMDFSLWNLLKETRSLECADQRDRVYALLSVATEGHKGIKADYDSTVTPLDLAHLALRTKYAVQPPWTLDNVLRDCEFLEDIFGITKGEITQCVEGDSCIRVNTGGIHDDLAWSIWARHYGYVAVQRLLPNNP
jgi:hypothetical protein